MAVFLARMVMPRSRSSSLESITRSTCASLARNVPLWFSMASTSVVLPWSTCAMMAILRRLLLKTAFPFLLGETACVRQTEGFGTGVFSLQYPRGFGFDRRDIRRKTGNENRISSSHPDVLCHLLWRAREYTREVE